MQDKVASMQVIAAKEGERRRRTKHRPQLSGHSMPDIKSYQSSWAQFRVSNVTGHSRNMVSCRLLETAHQSSLDRAAYHHGG